MAAHLLPENTNFALGHRPCFPQAVQWSDDNLIAVAAGSAVAILAPWNMSGPRGYVSTAKVEYLADQVGGLASPEDNNNIHCGLASLRARFGEKLSTVRSISWSPVGCSSTGTCILAVLTDDHRVSLLDALRHKQISQIFAAAKAGRFCLRFFISHSGAFAKKFGKVHASCIFLLPQVKIYGPSPSTSAEWKEVADLSLEMANSLRRTGWQVHTPQ